MKPKTPSAMNPLLRQPAPNATGATSKPVVFACDLKAMTPEQRKRYAEVLCPALIRAKLKTNELQDGYAFHFPSDAKTFATVCEWIGHERLCCPFFAFDLHVANSSEPMIVKITGPEGVKQFLKAELTDLVG